MRARRPELFSDTVLEEEATLTKSQLEFHLDTLTQRKEEIRFEHFSRKLAEKELCPNLLPQTGPTGGGDSKTDSETYPVANSILDRWYVGDPMRSAQERWAFAFSAKKDWRSKINSDVQKIVGTQRDYKLIYFITNQSVSDRNRSQCEDELSKKYSIDVRILDRTWILEKVVENKRWDVVFQTLDIESHQVNKRKQPGPQDVSRLLELEELDRQLEDSSRYQGIGYQLFEDCLHTALLARGLGRPRVEIDGRFDRAERIAKKCSDVRQQFQVVYNRAWTAYWWFDDFDELDRLYISAETLILNAGSVWDLEKLTNLWQVNTTARLVYRTNQEIETWKGSTENLRGALLRHASDISKPTSALWARTQLVFMDLTAATNDLGALPSVIKNIKSILSEAEGHLEYPMMPVIQIVLEAGEIFGNEDEFDELFETAINLQSRRSSDAEQGEMRLKRGFQKLKSNKPYEAIEQFAKAQSLLVQEEHKGEFLQSLVGIALGYEAAGLLWAARANLVFALDRTFYEFDKNREIKPQSLSLLRKLIWIELQLGRSVCVFIWLQLVNLLYNAVELSDLEKKELEEELGMMDAVFGILVLKTRFSDLYHLDKMAAVFKKHGLELARSAALFKLGYEDAFRAEYHQAENLDEIFTGWINQPTSADLPSIAEWHLGRFVTLQTVINGCEIELNSRNHPLSIMYGEAILAFLESLFSTLIRFRGSFAFRPSLRIEIKQSESALLPFSHEVFEDDCGETYIVVTHDKNSPGHSDFYPKYEKALTDLLTSIIYEIQLQVSQETLEELFGNQRAMSRAMLAAQSLVALTNVLGFQPKYQFKDWIDEEMNESLSLIRSEDWKKIEPVNSDSEKDSGSSPEFSDSLPPEGLFGVDALKHRDMRVHSPINMRLWDKASWRGLGFAHSEVGQSVPELILIFENFEEGLKIFRGWHKRLGNVDKDEWISLTIITGIEKEHPSHYRVAISVNANLFLKNGQQAAFVARMKDMTPKDTLNLDRFKSLFSSYGCYKLSLGKMINGRLTPHLESKLSLQKRQVRIIPAWQIGPNDPAMLALRGITNPIIPEDVLDPPIKKAWDRLNRIPE